MNGARSIHVSPGPILEPLEARLLLDAATAQQAIELFHTTPAVFIENQGQWADASVRFVHRGQGANIAHTDSGPVFELFREVPAAEDDAESREKGPDTFSEQPGEIERLRFSATFDGANAVRPVGLEQAETRFNFLVGDPSQWRQDVPSYEVVAYEGLYDGIDLHTWGRRDHLKYEFHVAPGADYSAIRITYDGIAGLSLADDGSLVVDLGADWGRLVDDAPYIYQQLAGERVAVPGRFVLLDESTYGFELTGGYDPSRELIVDPDLDWSSYLGGGGRDCASGVAADASGNVLVAGYTSSSGWVSGGWDTSHGGGWDGFVAKLSPTGGHVWSSYLGGGGSDYASGVAADASGNVLVAGETYSSGWVSGGWDTSHGGRWDGFVAKLSPTGGHVWSSYLGGAIYDGAYGVAADASGNVLVAGYTYSSGWVSGGWDTSYAGFGDGFAVKLSPTGGHLWSSYLGGGSDDRAHGVAADASGNVLVAGETHSSGWVSGGWDTSYAGGSSDGFLVKLSPTGGHVWSSYLGGADYDAAYAVAADASGSVLLAGETSSSGWVSGGWDTSYGGDYDAFLAKLSPTGGHVWSTYLGGGNDERALGVAADASGNVLVAGYTSSSGWVSGGWDTSYGGDTDGFVARITIDTIAPTADAWYSAAEHDQGIGQVLLEIPDDGTFCEPRMAGVAELRIEFSEAIDPASFTPASVLMAGNDDLGNPVDLSGVAVTTSTTAGDMVGIIDFTPALPDVARYLVRIEDVTDAAGNPLTGDNDRVFTALAGDATGGLRVNAIDLSYIWPRRTTLIDGVSEDQTRSDVNCDGRINAIDLSAAWPRRGADMRDVPDPVLSGKLSAAGMSGDVLADALAAAAWVGGERVDALERVDPGRAGPGRWRSGGPRASLGYRRRAEVRGAVGASRTRSDDVVTVPIETAALEGPRETPVAAVDAELRDVLALSVLLPSAL